MLLTSKAKKFLHQLSVKKRTFLLCFANGKRKLDICTLILRCLFAASFPFLGRRIFGAFVVDSMCSSAEALAQLH